MVEQARIGVLKTLPGHDSLRMLELQLRAPSYLDLTFTSDPDAHWHGAPVFDVEAIILLATGTPVRTPFGWFRSMAYPPSAITFTDGKLIIEITLSAYSVGLSYPQTVVDLNNIVG